MKRVELFLDSLIWLFRPERVLNSPRILHIEVTKRCNLACIMCPRTISQKNIYQKSKSKTEDEDLSFDKFCYILSQCNNTRRIRMHGLGEPLLNPNLIAMIQEANGRGLETEFTTNATLLNEYAIKDLINANLTYLTVSIDGASQSTYETIRVGANFYNVINNLHKLSEIKRKTKSNFPILTVNMVLMRHNLKELPEVMQLANEIGAKKLQASLITPPEAAMFELMPDRFEWFDMIKIANNQAKNLDIIFENHHAIQLANRSYNLKTSNSRCRRPWFTLYIRLDGYVSPCCNIYDPEVLGNQNVYNKSITDIWNSFEIIRFRKQLKKGPLHPSCLKCSSM